MGSGDTMTNEEMLVETLRQRLRIHLAQSATFGINVPAHILTQIDEARTQIAGLKLSARQLGYTIADQAIDTAPKPSAPESHSAQPAHPVDRSAAVRVRLRQIETLLHEIEQLL